MQVFGRPQTALRPARIAPTPAALPQATGTRCIRNPDQSPNLPSLQFTTEMRFYEPESPIDRWPVLCYNSRSDGKERQGRTPNENDHGL